jgi:hypothetical protein
MTGMDSLNFRTRIFENVKAAFDTVGHIDQAIRIDIEIVEHGRLLSLRWRRNEEAHFFGPELVSDIKDPKAGIIIGDEDNILALKRSRPILVHVVGTEPQSPFTEIPLRDRARANDHRVSFLPDIDQPNPLLAFLTVIFHRLIDGHYEFPAG